MRVSIALLSCFITCHLQAQSIPTKWSISFGLGFEEHDERLFDFPNAVQILAQEKDAGTRNYSIFFQRQLPIASKISASVGLGYTQKVATFSRPFNHCYFQDGDCPYVLLYVERLRHQLIQLPIDFSYTLWSQNSWSLWGNFNILPSLAWQKSIEARSQAVPFRKNEWDVYALALHLGPIAEWNSIFLQLQYRVYQWIAKEETYLYSADFRANNPRYFETQNESFNPSKFWLLLGYRF